MAGGVENMASRSADGLAVEAGQEEERSMSTVAMNQIFRVGVGFAAWCALRQVLMVWLTYV